MAANMKHICVLVFVLVAAAVIAGDTTSPTSTSSTSTTTTTTATSTTTSTTTTTTTPTPPPTTTKAPPKTTKKPTSSSTTPSTTQPLTPTPTTTAKPTTTPVPAPLDHWVVGDKDGIKCILMQAKINITYNNVPMMVPQPNNGSTANGTCGNSSQTIEIYFSGGPLKLVFSAASEPGKHRLAALSFRDTSLNISSNKFWANEKGLLSNKLYKCDARVELYAEGNNSIAVSGMKLEVFRTSNSTAFNSDTVTCSSDSSVNNLVPIIVGACLGGLILIVLIAYLIGRKRSRHGYEQV